VDFNLVIDLYIGYQNYIHVNNPNARDLVLEQIMERSLGNFTQNYKDTRGVKKVLLKWLD
jgi:hypothetical protein